MGKEHGELVRCEESREDQEKKVRMQENGMVKEEGEEEQEEVEEVKY